MHLSLFLPNGDVVLNCITFACHILTNVELFHANVESSHLIVIVLGGYHLMSCLKDVPLLRGDNYSEWRKKVDLAILRLREKFGGGLQ